MRQAPTRDEPLKQPGDVRPTRHRGRHGRFGPNRWAAFLALPLLSCGYGGSGVQPAAPSAAVPARVIVTADTSRHRPPPYVQPWNLVPVDTLRLSSLGERHWLVAEVRDANGDPVPDAPLSWSLDVPGVVSSGRDWFSIYELGRMARSLGLPEVARLDSSGGDGWLSSVGNGTATLTVSAGPASASVSIVVRQVPASARPASASLSELGEAVQLSATVRDAVGWPMPGAEEGMAWHIDDPGVADVGPDGLLTAAGVGKTTVHATLGEVTGSAPVEVTRFDSDREVLTHFFDWMGGPGWTRSDNWLTDAPLSDWWGIETDERCRRQDSRIAENVDGAPAPPA